jgi:hypothetical protein
MRKISLIPYKVEGEDYKVKESIINLLFSPHLRLGMRAAIENDRIAKKVESATEEVLLEEAEYQKIKNAVETFEGYSRQDLEFGQRILEAPEVPVKEATT